MITIGYSTRFPNPTFSEYLKKSCGLKDVQIIEKVNNGEKSLSKVYNEILDESTNDIVVLCHDDITLETKNWGNKLIKLFESNPEYGILGVAGTKYLSQSGRWWEKQKKMYGRVQHTHEGKTWLSKYSSDLGQNIEEVVLVDGLFFFIDKTKITKTFDESVKGFHFYDVNFCFQNFINKTKVGVTTSIRVNHRSIGMTNNQWEENRIQFAEKFKNYLPSFVPYKKTDKFKVLVNVSKDSDIQNLTQLIENLQKNKYEVSLISEIPKQIGSRFNKKNIHCYDLNLPPGYKIGDGKWSLNTQNGVQVSQEGVMYKITETPFDIVINYDKNSLTKIIKLYPDKPKVSLDTENKGKNHISVKKEIDISELLNNEIEIITDCLNSEYVKSNKQKIKILSGFSEKGGSTTIFTNLTNFFNKNGFDCVFYGPHDYHLDKCKSGFQQEVNFEPDDVVISHFINLNERPNVKKIVFACHEKWWFDFSKVNKFWDTAIFLHKEHREFHKNYHGDFEIIPNIKEELNYYGSFEKNGITTYKKDLDLIAGIIGTIEDRKQTHISIKRALSDKCEKVILFGHIGDNSYYEKFVKPLIDNQKVILNGHSTNKQEMYNSIGRVYHSSKGEVACLVKDECFLTGTKFFGNEETEHEVSPLNNSGILNLWKKVLQI